MRAQYARLAVILIFPAFVLGADSLASGDARVRCDAATGTWVLETTVIEQRLELAAGKFRLATLRNRLSGTELAGADSDEFRFVFAGREYSGRTAGYKLESYRIARLPVPKTAPGIEPGVSLEISLEHTQVRVTLHYDVYASTPRTPMGMIRKWYRVTNRTTQSQPLTEIGMNRIRFRNDLAEKSTLYWWQGGGAQQGTNDLHAEPLAKQRNRTFDSMSGAAGFRVDDVYDGSASYHPYFVLQDDKAGEGVFLGFNYLGPWTARFWNAGDYPGRGGTLAATAIQFHTEPLASGASFDSPNSFIGVYKGDLDTAGEQLQDWQATYKWDLTREKYLWTTGIYNGHWDDDTHKQKLDLHTREMWRIAGLCQQTGAQIAHEDDFWFDQRGRGVWEGIDWAELVRYLKQSGILFRLWMPPQHFAPGTPPDQHSEWALVPKAPDGITGWYGLGFCVAAQGAHDYMRQFMLAREKRYGDYYYRLDGWVQAPCWATGHDHPPGQPHVNQYRHYLQMLREVKEANPGMGLQGCNSGGEWCNWDKLELLENNQASDGGGPDDLYYLSYFWSITKLIEGSAGSTQLEAAAAEDLRMDVLMRRYFRQEGVFDRYMRVYHPRAEGAPDSHTYLQITNAARTKAVILQDTLPKGEVVVYPKRLEPGSNYHVAFRFNKSTWSATGAQLMTEGIRFRPLVEREMVLLNLDSAPGRGADTTAPSVPGKVSKRRETWGGHDGIALRWLPSEDNVMVAGYEISRDGKLVDRVSIGTFYFDRDPSATPTSRYEVVAFDGDANRSAGSAAAP
ncbi:MAG: hypothetical protein U0Q18_15990 [Bryobacteraceae bacterium]